VKEIRRRVVRAANTCGPADPTEHYEEAATALDTIERWGRERE
jgi:hypothetical protein